VTPAHIGIVACSAEGAALCYRTIVHESGALLGAHGHPEVSLSSLALSRYMERIERGDWHGVAELMLESAAKLSKAGADFLICPDNTLHQALPLVESRSPRPWLHIAEEVAKEALARRYRRLGILGTRWLIESDVYPRALAARELAFVLPEPAERGELNRIIMDELVCGLFKPQGLVFHQRLIEQMKRTGCDAVVLGCTEIPLLVNDTNSPLPTLDSTRLLARAALRRALAEQ
jgi:aspartate racemase